MDQKRGDVDIAQLNKALPVPGRAARVQLRAPAPPTVLWLGLPAVALPPCLGWRSILTQEHGVPLNVPIYPVPTENTLQFPSEPLWEMRCSSQACHVWCGVPEQLPYGATQSLEILGGSSKGNYWSRWWNRQMLSIHHLMIISELQLNYSTTIVENHQKSD